MYPQSTAWNVKLHAIIIVSYSFGFITENPLVPTRLSEIPGSVGNKTTCRKFMIKNGKYFIFFNIIE